MPRRSFPSRLVRSLAVAYLAAGAAVLCSACGSAGAATSLPNLVCPAGNLARSNGSTWECALPELPAPCASGAPLVSSGTGWRCGGDVSSTGQLDLLGNGAGAIASFAPGDPQAQSNPSYDAANPTRLSIYVTTALADGDLTALCRTGDEIVSGGCVVSGDNCYVQRSYPIVAGAGGQSGWHCREIDRTTASGCANITAIGICLKRF